MISDEQNKEVEVALDGDIVKKMTLAPNNPHVFNQLDLSPAVLSKSLKVTVTASYTQRNNGFQEIRVWKQEGLTLMANETLLSAPNVLCFLRHS